MEEIYSEEDFKENIGSSWGQWKFSMSNEEINRKLDSLPKLHVDDVDQDCEHWSKLFLLLKQPQHSPEYDIHEGTQDDPPLDRVDLSMECTSILKNDEIEPMNDDIAEECSVEELSICLADLCNQVAPKLKLGLHKVQDEMKNITEDLSKLKESTLSSIMINAWSQLSTEASKLCFCIPFTPNRKVCKTLCEVIIIPWFSKGPPSKIEQLSTILLPEGETVCLYLVVPLLKNGDSPLAKDILALEELMSSFKEKHWTVLLKELLSDLRELQKWLIPSLALIVDHANPSNDEIHLLIQVMSSSGTAYSQSRDFGALIVAVAKSLGENDLSLALQLKLITNNYKGPLKFKALKILEEIED